MRYFLLLLLLPLLAACGGRSSGSTPSLPPQQPSTVPLGSVAALSEAQSDATEVPLPLYTPSTADLLYVGNQGNNSITIYRHDANGNTAPLKVISGSKTGINAPGQLSEDAHGNLYVANQSSILVFAHAATGNVAPIRKLAGPLTGLQAIEGLTVDQATGKIFVFNFYFNSDDYPSFNFARFPPNATGNQAPFASVDLGTSAFQLAQDSTGKNIIEAQGPGVADSFAGIDWMAKQFPNGGPLNGPPYGISFFQALGVADDPSTHTYLVAGGDHQYNGIVRFAEKTTGYGSDNPDGTEDLTPAPISEIKNACAGQLALGYLRNIYTTCGNAIDVYAHDASGNVSPLRILKGSATKLNHPYGIYEGQ